MATDAFSLTIYIQIAYKMCIKPLSTHTIDQLCIFFLVYDKSHLSAAQMLGGWV